MTRHKNVFLLTLWVVAEDADGAGLAKWRGCVEHLATKRRLYFSELTDLVRYVEQHIDRSQARAEPP
jgi:hypothetical protein